MVLMKHLLLVFNDTPMLVNSSKSVTRSQSCARTGGIYSLTSQQKTQFNKTEEVCNVHVTEGTTNESTQHPMRIQREHSLLVIKASVLLTSPHPFRILFQPYTLSNDVSRPTFNAIPIDNMHN
jgi:hypothetical protein